MGRRGDHSLEQIRRLALDSADKLVRRRDPSVLSLRKVAADIGYAPSSLYLVFKNREDLVQALNGRTFDRISEATQKALAEAPKGDKAVEKVSRAYLEFAAKQKGLWRLAFEGSWTSARRPDSYQLKIDGAIAPLKEAVRRMLQGRPEKEMAQAGQQWWMILQGLVALSAPDRAFVGADEASDEGLSILLKAFARAWKPLKDET